MCVPKSRNIFFLEKNEMDAKQTGKKRESPKTRWK